MTDVVDADPTLRRGSTAVAAWALVVGTVVAWVASSRLRATVDSFDYLVAARSLARGDGLLDAAGRPFSQFAPGYPALLALFGKVAGGGAAGLVVAARWAGALSLGVTAAGVAAGVTRATRSLRLGAGAAAVAVGGWPLLMARSVWSEAPFTAWTVIGVVVAAAALERRSRSLLALAGTALGLAAATRYSGLVLVVLAVPVAWRWQRSEDDGRGGHRSPLGPALASALALGLPVLVVGSAAPLLHAGSGVAAFGPRPPAVTSVLTVLGQAVLGLVQLVVPPAAVVPTPVLAVAVAVAAVAAVLRVRRGGSLRPPRLAPSVPTPAVGVLAAWAVTASVAATVAAALGTRIDDLDAGRLLVPCAPLAVLWATARLDGERVERVAVAAISARGRSAPAWRAPAAVAAALAVLVAGTSLASADTGGVGFTALEVVPDPGRLGPGTAGAVRGWTGPVVSNLPAAAAWQLDVAIETGPATAATAPASLGGGRTLAVWFDGGRRDVIDRATLAARCQLVRWSTSPGVTVDRVTSCRPVSRG